MKTLYCFTSYTKVASENNLECASQSSISLPVSDLLLILSPLKDENLLHLARLIIFHFYYKSIILSHNTSFFRSFSF